MKRLLTAEQMKRCDSYTIEMLGVPSRELMGRAAAAAFECIMSGGFDLTRVLCICGTGNNGGDGLAVAKLLWDAGIGAEYLICGDESKMTPECRYRCDVLRVADVLEQKQLDLDGVTLIVDAILGIGLSGEVRQPTAEVIRAVAESGIPAVALDIPSGIDSDTGAVMGCAVTAELTVAFARLKPGHILYPGRLYCGRTAVADIGIGEKGIAEDSFAAFVPDAADIAEMLPKRAPYSHKGTYGRLLVVAGCEGMCGAAYFSALGAYRSGAGLVEVFTPKANLPVIQGKIPEAIATGWAGGAVQLLRRRMREASAVVIGPGLGKSTDAARLVEEALDSGVPLLIDADALNIISESDDLREKLKRRRSPTVITPHMAEMSRLSGKNIGEIIADPIKSAADFAKKYGVVCVQKDSATVIACGDRAFVNTTGCSGLAKGGSGDVLTGVIGAFLAAGVPEREAAVAGVYLHGRAGEIASQKLSEYSLLATDIADGIGDAIKEILEA